MHCSFVSHIVWLPLPSREGVGTMRAALLHLHVESWLLVLSGTDCSFTVVGLCLSSCSVVYKVQKGHNECIYTCIFFVVDGLLEVK